MNIAHAEVILNVVKNTWIENTFRFFKVAMRINLSGLLPYLGYVLKFLPTDLIISQRPVLRVLSAQRESNDLPLNARDFYRNGDFR